LLIDYRSTVVLNLHLNQVELFDDKYDFFKETLKLGYSEIERATILS
jgi:hypothetical protein